MTPVTVVTDTTHYLPPELLSARGVRQVSLYVRWGDQQQREADMPGFDGFYERLRAGDELPTTSQPSVGDFIATYEPLLADGGEIVSVHLASGVSGTFQSALQARAQLVEQGRGGERIEVIDSATACGGLGMVVLAAAACAASGGDRGEVAQRARDARAALHIWFGIDTLEFLRRGGRIGRAAAWVGSTLQIKPILSFDSEITPIERVRTSARMFERMCAFMETLRDEGADGWVVQHIQAPDRANALVERGCTIFGCEPLWVSELGPVVGAHVGPGLLGVGGLPVQLLR